MDPRRFRNASPRILQLARDQRLKDPPDPRPTEAEARRIEPMIPLWASGQVPVDLEAQHQMKRYFEVKRRAFRRPTELDDGGVPATGPVPDPEHLGL